MKKPLQVAPAPPGAEKRCNRVKGVARCPLRIRSIHGTVLSMDSYCCLSLDDSSLAGRRQGDKIPGFAVKSLCFVIAQYYRRIYRHHPLISTRYVEQMVSVSYAATLSAVTDFIEEALRIAQSTTMLLPWRCSWALVVPFTALASSATAINPSTTRRDAQAYTSRTRGAPLNHGSHSTTSAAVPDFPRRRLRKGLWVRGGQSRAAIAHAQNAGTRTAAEILDEDETVEMTAETGLAVTTRGGARGARASEKAAGGGGSRVSARWPMFSAFLYVLAMALTIPGLPRVVNQMLTGSKTVTAASATVYGLLSSTDALFTLLTVNFHATMSDKFGRRPFMALSALGLGTGFLITYHSTAVWMLLIAAAIDGCTSCMYSLAQASITDCVSTGPALGEAFGLFQGVSLGMAFMIGMPVGGVLASKYGARFPLLVSAGLCVLNVFVVVLLMPESLSEDNRKQTVDLTQANPLGAIKMATRSKLVSGVVGCWMLMWVAHVGLQINWINYTDRKFEWGVAQSGASLALMGLLVAVFPKLIIPRLGLERSITHGLLVYTCSQVLIAAAPGVRNEWAQWGTPLVVLGIVLTSAGTVVFPATLALLSNQVGEEEKGALQGAADTAKTICSVIFGPAMTWIFGYYIGESAYPRQIEGANYYIGAVIALMAWITARQTFAKYGSLDQSLPRL